MNQFASVRAQNLEPAEESETRRTSLSLKQWEVCQTNQVQDYKAQDSDSIVFWLNMCFNHPLKQVTWNSSSNQNGLFSLLYKSQSVRKEHL